MAVALLKTRTLTLLLAGCITLLPVAIGAQTNPPEARESKPLPDVVALMHDVESNQRKAESIQKGPASGTPSGRKRKRSTATGGVKKTTITEARPLLVERRLPVSEW